MLASFRHNLANLHRFSGRTSRGLFWPYAGIVLLLAIVLVAAVMLPFLAEAMARMQRFAAEHPDLATETVGPTSYSIEIKGNHPEVFPDLRPVLISMGAVVALVTLLLAAAVTRRLHDRNWRGWWALLPLIFLFFGLAIMPNAFEATSDEDLSLFFLMLATNWLYLATLGLLGFLLMLAGTPGANRYGPRPA